MRYALRVDQNQAQIISALEAAGALVEVIGKPVDLLVGINGRFAFFEVKDGAKMPSQRKKTPLQQRFFEKYAGYPICLVDSPEAALRHLNIISGMAIKDAA